MVEEIISNYLTILKKAILSCNDKLNLDVEAGIALLSHKDVSEAFQFLTVYHYETSKRFFDREWISLKVTIIWSFLNFDP